MTLCVAQVCFWLKVTGPKGTYHSALIMNLIKLKGTAKLTVQGERVCLKDSKYILFEILENQTWKGRTSSCRPSKPDSAI